MREKKSDKNQSELLAAAEAILFTMGKSVELSKMAEALGLSEAQTKALIEKLKEKYEDECCGFRLWNWRNPIRCVRKVVCTNI